MLAKSFYKNQRELAEALNTLVDMYWGDQLEEVQLIKNINNIYTNNKDKIFKQDHFTKILQQQCGKKRLGVIEKIINKQN